MPEPSRLLKLFLATIVAVILIAIMASAGLSTGSATINADTTSYTTLSQTVQGIPSTVTVKATQEHALTFDGNDSISSTAPQNLTTGSWTLCASPELSDTANLNATYDIFAYQNASLLLQYDAHHWSIYYNNSTHSAKTTLPATTPTDGFTQLCSRYNATTNQLVLIHESTYSDPEPLTTGITPRNISTNWTGRLDEIRTFNTATQNATINAYTQDPIQPLPGTNRSARFMLDEGAGTTTHVYFAGVDATLHGPTWTTGLPGPVLQEPSLLYHGDYKLKADPFRITIVDGGYLDGAPVEYVTWNGSPLGLDWAGIIATLSATLVLVVLANELKDYL